MSTGPGRPAPSGSEPPRRGPEPPARDALERVRAREPEAMGAFYERYVDAVFGLAFRLLGERGAAEDVTQEVFYKVYRAAHQLDPARDPMPWLVAILYNACRDLWRTGAHRLARRSDSIEENPVVALGLAARGEGPESELLRAERERLVQQALMEMPEHLRAAIVLHDWQGLSHLEIAERTGIEHAAARKRYSRALEALGKLLEGKLA